MVAGGGASVIYADTVCLYEKNTVNLLHCFSLQDLASKVSSKLLYLGWRSRVRI